MGPVRQMAVNERSPLKRDFTKRLSKGIVLAMAKASNMRLAIRSESRRRGTSAVLRSVG